MIAIIYSRAVEVGIEGLLVHTHFSIQLAWDLKFVLSSLESRYQSTELQKLTMTLFPGIPALTSDLDSTFVVGPGCGVIAEDTGIMLINTSKRPVYRSH